jgi:hypothetical protein
MRPGELSGCRGEQDKRPDPAKAGRMRRVARRRPSAIVVGPSK